MGRFARNDVVNRARYKRRRERESRIASRRHSRPEKRGGHNQRIVKLALLLIIIIAGASSGWMAGRILIGPSQDVSSQPQKIIESSAAAHNAISADQLSIEPDPQEITPEKESRASNHRRESKERGFNPSKIVTEPARIISKPFKKLNPFRLF
ncbi:MAG TPA: hypothetical protein VNN73_16020 [Blastocatellia bacterium]|nr:hypothetical protein [Blastocatellia bacterium]